MIGRPGQFLNLPPASCRDSMGVMSHTSPNPVMHNSLSADSNTGAHMTKRAVIFDPAEDEFADEERARPGRKNLLGGSGKSPILHVRVTAAQKDSFDRIGGPDWLRKMLDLEALRFSMLLAALNGTPPTPAEAEPEPEPSKPARKTARSKRH